MIKLLARFSACLATLIAVVAAIWATRAIYFDSDNAPDFSERIRMEAALR
jgi:hypothetical protein